MNSGVSCGTLQASKEDARKKTAVGASVRELARIIVSCAALLNARSGVSHSSLGPRLLAIPIAVSAVVFSTSDDTSIIPDQGVLPGPLLAGHPLSALIRQLFDRLLVHPQLFVLLFHYNLLV